MLEPPSAEKHSNTKIDFLAGKENAVLSLPDMSIGNVTPVKVTVCEPAPFVRIILTVA